MCSKHTFSHLSRGENTLLQTKYLVTNEQLSEFVTILYNTLLFVTNVNVK